MAPRMPAARNALRVLALLAGYAGPVKASTIARELGVPRSSTYQLLQVMRDEGFLVHYPEQAAWGSSALVHEIGARTLAATRLEQLAQPLLDALVRDCPIPATAHLAVLAGADVAYAGRGATTRSPVTVSRVGVRLPTLRTATGRALLAALDDAQVLAIVPKQQDLAALTPPTRAALSSMLHEVRKQGWAWERGDIDDSYASVAAAALDATGYPAAALGITFRLDSVPFDDWSALGALVVDAAAALTVRLAPRRRA